VFHSEPVEVTGFYLIDSAIAHDGEVFFASLKQLVLPALTMGIFSLAPIARMTRASMLAVLASDFVRTARASGLTPYTVIVVYAFRNAMLPVVTTLGMVFSFLLGANVLVEKVFAWPGLGSYAVEALIASDFAPVCRTSGRSTAVSAPARCCWREDRRVRCRAQTAPLPQSARTGHRQSL
jgi:peptide/nickel transport system permease protein